MDPDSAYFVVEQHVGRVVEARVWGLDSVAVADRYSAAIGRVAATMPLGTTGVLVADHRFAPIYPQPVTDGLLALFRQMNTRLQRIAIVVNPRQATFYMQLRRIVREAGNEARRVFREIDGALQHLAPVLTPQELARVRVFLAAGPAQARRRDPG
jgi:hypothetical protein